MPMTTPSTRASRLTDQRRSLPDGPGVYLFRDEGGTVVYVGKAKSIRKRVAGHFSNVKGAGATRGAIEMVGRIHQIEFLLVSSEAEALLTENQFIKE
ncbi:MAG TPA: nucleotide excision repair endonuclease, partial [Solirubrobacteraceae bacterium]